MRSVPTLQHSTAARDNSLALTDVLLAADCSLSRRGRKQNLLARIPVRSLQQVYAVSALHLRRPSIAPNIEGESRPTSCECMHDSGRPLHIPAQKTSSWSTKADCELREQRLRRQLDVDWLVIDPMHALTLLIALPTY